MSDVQNSRSPRWGSTTKLVVGLSFVALLVFLLISFKQLIGPLLIAFILSYLIHPLVERLTRLLKLPWRFTVTIVYLLILVIFLGLLTWGGIALVTQIQNLIVFLQQAINNLPNTITQISANPIQILGRYTIDLGHLDLISLSNQLLSVVQPLLSHLGSLVGTLASGAFNLVGWALFIFFVSYFMLAETLGFPGKLFDLNIPGYYEDLKRIGYELSRIWNAFLRNQLIIFTIAATLYTVLFGILGVNFYFGLAILAGLARFVPYVGPGIAWLTYGVVCYFQGHTILGLTPIGYALLVVGISYVTDNIIDSVLVPRLMADALRVHPAAVMVAALIAFNFMGIIGVILAAPVLATFQLFTRYSLRKLLDLDPWAGMKTEPPKPAPKLQQRFWTAWGGLKLWMQRFVRNHPNQ
jgi:predicted PurR-regulated permease PerM